MSLAMWTRPASKRRTFARRYLLEAARALELADIEVEMALRESELEALRPLEADLGRPLVDLAQEVANHLTYLGLK